MFRETIIFGLILAASALPKDYARVGSAGVSYVGLNGALVLQKNEDSLTQTFVFTTGEDVGVDQMVMFKCVPLEDIYAIVEGSQKSTILCHGTVPATEKSPADNITFVFSADGIESYHGEKEVNLLLEKSIVSKLSAISDTAVETPVLGTKTD